MTDSCEARWKPTQNQIDDLILPAYTEMAKKSVEYIAKFQCPLFGRANLDLSGSFNDWKLNLSESFI